ncbi:hypothetical protein ACGYLO_18165 [Sulfitobacter sp. 1A13353]|jgi:hypothetical protein|uniref:hypothetical protein n=1 Tax=Sulfitobacter sp. 1A13353 TaxID=3368568 RepID=UPI0037475EB2
MQDASLAEASVEEKTADQLLIEDLMDKIEGLTADLEDAVEVAVSRGAVEWAALNYPDHPALKSEARPMTVVAAAGVSALKVARAKALAAVAAAKRQIRGQGPIEGVFTEMDAEDVENFMVSNAALAAALEREIRDFMPETRKALLEKQHVVAKNIAAAEREACIAAVARTVAPVVGTPYSVGPRKFKAAIANLEQTDISAFIGNEDLF